MYRAGSTTVLRASQVPADPSRVTCAYHSASMRDAPDRPQQASQGSRGVLTSALRYPPEADL